MNNKHNVAVLVSLLMLLSTVHTSLQPYELEDLKQLQDAVTSTENTDEAILVTFYSPSCKFSKRVLWVLPFLMKSHQMFKFYTIDAQTHHRNNHKFSVFGYPSIQIFAEGAHYATYHGNISFQPLHLWLSKIKLQWLAELQLKHQALSYCPLDDKTHLNISAMVCHKSDKQKHALVEERTQISILDLPKMEEISPPPGFCDESTDVYLWISLAYVIGISVYCMEKAIISLVEFLL